MGIMNFSSAFFDVHIYKVTEKPLEPYMTYNTFNNTKDNTRLIIYKLVYYDHDSATKDYETNCPHC